MICSEFPIRVQKMKRQLSNKGTEGLSFVYTANLLQDSGKVIMSLMFPDASKISTECETLSIY